MKPPRKGRRVTPKYRKRKRPNILGNCRMGRMGGKDEGIMLLKRKLRNWKSNKPAQKGVYTD